MLVGRAEERERIDRLLASARLGSSGALVVLGDPGVGKTALIDEALSGQEGLRVLRATGLESEQELPFAALLQLLRPALGLIGSIPRAQSDALAAALSLDSERPGSRPGARDRFAIGAAVLALVCRYAEDGPVALVVDDLHLVDRPSADALVFAARRLGADPVAVLATARDPAAASLTQGLPVMRLLGLDEDGARDLLSGHRADPLTAEQLALLHRVTGGNPLALLELASTDLSALGTDLTELPLRVPVAVTTAFARRLDQLDPGCLAGMLVAAVCAGDLQVTAEACARLGVDVGQLADAESAELVTLTDGRVRFRHPLIRAAVYSIADTRERRSAHQAVADVLPTGDVDRRAWHLSEAIWHPDASVSALLSEAAGNAARRAAYSVASTAYERAARLSPGVDTRADLSLRAAESAWLAGLGDRALGLLDRHRSEAVRGPHVRELELRAAIAARSGSLREAMDLLLAAAEEVDSPDDAAVLVADAVHAAFYLGDARVSEELATRQVALLPRVTAPRARALALMSTGIARVLAGHGGVQEIRDAVPMLETIPELREDPRRLPWLLLAPLFLREAAVGARLQAIVDEVRESAGVGALPAVLFHRAREQATTKEWSRAEANYLEAIRLAAETGQATEEAMSLAGLAWLESRQGNEVGCREHAAQARALCAGRDMYLCEVWAACAVADLDLSLGHADAALEELCHVTAVLDAHGLRDPDLYPGPELAEALVRAGRADEAAAIAEQFRARAEDKGQPWARARAERAIALLAPDDQVDARFEAALVLHEETLDEFESARTLLAYGERLRRGARRVDARARLRAALETFERLGATRWADRAAAELEATGETLRRTRGLSVPVLTPQELQVSLLLADGRTTREAAAALFLSPKTVEYHLRKVYTKLGVRTRDGLAAALRDAETTPP